MPTLTIRLSDKEKKELLKYGNMSEVLREGFRMYVKTKKKEEIFRRLDELQKRNPVRVSSSELVKMIREDRNR